MENAALSRAGNVQRAEWRQKCRQTLSDHLYTKHGLVIKPAQVRLRPNAEDGYLWATLPGKEHLFAKRLSKHSTPGKEHLFTKQLSKYSTGAYIELCREVGKTFEAVVLPASMIDTSEAIAQDSTVIEAATFTSKIVQLEEENVKLTNTLSCTKQEAKADSAARLDAVEQAQQLRLDLHAAQTRVENLSETNEKLSSEVRRLTKRIVRFEREVKKLLLTLHRLSPAVNYDDVQQ